VEASEELAAGAPVSIAPASLVAVEAGFEELELQAHKPRVAKANVANREMEFIGAQGNPADDGDRIP
jgi:hypothetical protein